MSICLRKKERVGGGDDVSGVRREENAVVFTADKVKISDAVVAQPATQMPCAETRDSFESRAQFAL